MIKEKLEKTIKEILERLSISPVEISLEHPEEISHGDYSSNVALAYAKKFGMSPMDLAKRVTEKLKFENLPEIEKVEIAGPGFINIFLSKKFFAESVSEIGKAGKAFGRNGDLSGKKVILDYTDPNPFKEFHIGHLMSNAIGEALSRIIEFRGAEVKRVCYQGDVGLHVAKTMWGILLNKKDFPKEKDSLSSRIKFLGSSYSLGSEKYENDEVAKKEIIELNKKIFDRTDKEINKIYDLGKKWSLEHFAEIYKKLDTNFDYFIFESETGPVGQKIVEEGFQKGIFEKSDGAIVYRGDKRGLHIRVFINSEGLPTYEAKDLGLAKIKYEKYPYDLSVVVTGNEINDYFKVMLSAMGEMYPELSVKTKHVGHGMLRLPTGKMSSRTGKVITGESLLSKTEEMVLDKVKDRELSPGEKKEIAGEVSVGAIKYSILRQSIGSDIIYDFDKSISFEGDSGPYLQYSYTRAKSILDKAKGEGVKSSVKVSAEEVGILEKYLYRFPEIVKRAGEEYEPHHISTYLMELSSAFNAYYANNKIVDKNDKFSSYKVALTEAFTVVMKNGLWLLGIKAPEKM